MGLSRRHVVTAVCSVLVLDASIAWACIRPPPPVVPEGWLGFTVTVAGPEPRSIPRNAALRGDTAPTRLGTPLAIERLPELGGLLSRVVELLPAGEWVDSANGSALVVDIVDVTPPTAPVVEGGAFEIVESDAGCFGSSDCDGERAKLSVDIAPATDDATPAERLSYAVFLGTTRAEAEAATIPDDIYTRDFEGTVWRDSQRREGDTDIWVSVAAIDLAGNVGPRSEPMQIHSVDDGCAVHPIGGRTQTPIAVSIAIAILIARARRRCRRSSSE